MNDGVCVVGIACGNRSAGGGEGECVGGRERAGASDAGGAQCPGALAAVLMLSPVVAREVSSELCLVGGPSEVDLRVSEVGHTLCNNVGVASVP